MFCLKQLVDFTKYMKEYIHSSIKGILKSFMFKFYEQVTIFEQNIWKYRFCSPNLHRSKIREQQLKIEQND